MLELPLLLWVSDPGQYVPKKLSLEMVQWRVFFSITSSPSIASFPKEEVFLLIMLKLCPRIRISPKHSYIHLENGLA